MLRDVGEGCWQLLLLGSAFSKSDPQQYISLAETAQQLCITKHAPIWFLIRCALLKLTSAPGTRRKPTAFWCVIDLISFKAQLIILLPGCSPAPPHWCGGAAAGSRQKLKPEPTCVWFADQPAASGGAAALRGGGQQAAGPGA